ncbi:MAG: MFS transporter [Alphaproteobacteria bacterium]|nr:MFS transporter [Alphaproteobacteria bacterium]
MSVESNIRKLFCDRFFSSFWIAAPIIVPFYQSNGLNATQVFTIQAIFSAACLVFEIPTGYLSDVIGRKKTMIAGAALLPIGLAVYAFSHGFFGFVAAEIIIALANSLRSGTDTAFLYDTLIELKREKEHKRLEGTGHFLSSTGVGVAAVIGGLLSTLSLRTPFYANGLVFCVLLPLAISMREPKREAQTRKPMKEHGAELVKAVRYCLHHYEIRNAAIYSAILESTGIIGIWTYFLYYGKLGIGLGYYGIIAAAFGFINGTGGKLAHAVEAKIGRTAALSLPLLIAPSFLFLGQMQTIYALPLIYLNAFLWGFATPLLRDFVHQRTPSRIRATTLSVVSMGGRICYVLIAVPVGKIIDMYSLQTAHMFLGAVFLMVGSLALLSLFSQRRVAEH